MAITDHIIVRPNVEVPHRGVLYVTGFEFPCALGSSGVTPEKVEGDGATPSGNMNFRRGFYRKDRLERPNTALPMDAIGRLDGWSDDPRDKDYNRFILHPETGKRPFSAERLWREDDIYNVILVLGHNDEPPVAGLGSAIFMHLVRGDFEPTEGCVALREPDLLLLLRHITTETVLTVDF